MPHLEPVSGVPSGEAPTSGVPGDSGVPGLSGGSGLPDGSSTMAATDQAVAADAPATEPSATFASSAAPTAGAPFPNTSFAWSYPPLTRRMNNTALASMIVSLASFVTCPLLGLLGVYLGTRARNEIKTRGEDGDGMALAGIIAGWVAAGLSVLLVVFYALIVGVIVSAVAINGGR